MCPRMCPGSLPRQRGLGLVAAIFVVTIMALIAVGLTRLTVTAQQAYGLEIQNLRAFLAAQAGLELELNRLMPPSSFPAGHGDLTDTSGCLSASGAANSYNSLGAPGLGGCRVEVRCRSLSVATASAFQHRLDSTGICGSGLDEVRRQLRVLFSTPASP